MTRSSGKHFKTGLIALTTAMAALSTSVAWAQDTSSELRYSWLPYTTSGYVGASVGMGELHTNCAPGLSCEDPDTSGKIYTGGMFNPYLGMELGYIQWGKSDRNGGTQKARGVNAMLAGYLPLGSMLTLVGKVGTTYGWTKTSVGTLVARPAGNEDGFAVAYGAGLSFDFHRNWSATVDWERHKLKFANDGRQDVDLTSVGIKYRF